MPPARTRQRRPAADRAPRQSLARAAAAVKGLGRPGAGRLPEGQERLDDFLRRRFLDPVHQRQHVAVLAVFQASASSTSNVRSMSVYSLPSSARVRLWTRLVPVEGADLPLQEQLRRLNSDTDTSDVGPATSRAARAARISSQERATSSVGCRSVFCSSPFILATPSPSACARAP